MDRMSRTLAVVGWDGLLPMAVAAAPVMSRQVFQKGHIAEVVAAILVPVVAALIRAGVAHRQISEVCGGRVPLARQAAMSIAITLLLLFEASSGVLTCADDAPVSAWLVPASLYLAYLAYLAVIIPTLRQSSPASSSLPPSADFPA